MTKKDIKFYYDLLIYSTYNNVLIQCKRDPPPCMRNLLTCMPWTRAFFD